MIIFIIALMLSITIAFNHVVNYIRFPSSGRQCYNSFKTDFNSLQGINIIKWFCATISEQLAAKDPVFSWYPKWIELYSSGQLRIWIKDGMCQPPTIKIQWSTCNRHKMSCDVTPDKGIFWPEYALACTSADFNKILLVCWERDHLEDEV